MHDVISARGRDAGVDQVLDARRGNMRDDLTDLAVAAGRAARAVWWPVLLWFAGNVKR